MITKNKVFLMLIIVILNLIQLVGCKNSDMSIEEFRTPEYSIEWLGEGEIKTITTTKGYKNIKIKDFNITTSENEQHAQSLNVDKSMYVPQELKLNFNFENYYLLLDELTKNDKIDQALVYTKDSNRYNSIENKEFFRIITKEGNMLYEVVSVTGDFILNSTEKRLISDKCKKLVCVNDERSLWGEDTTYKWGYLTLNGDFYYFGNAERKDLTHDIFGEKLVTSVQSKYYENELVLKNIDDIWITEMGFMYIQEGNLVVLGADTKKVISENVSGISSVDVCGWDIYTNPTVIYATESGELFGFGKNIGYVINENATSNYVYMSPQKIDTSIKVKDLYFADNFGVYVVDFNNDLYYWGYPGLKIKYNYSDKMLKEKKNFNLLISSTNPILVASDVENVSCYKNKIRSFNETTGVISTYWIKKSKTKTKGKYTIEINKQHINTGFKKYFNKYLMIKDDKFIFDPTVVKNKYVSYTKGFRASEKTIFASNWWLQYGEFEKKSILCANSLLSCSRCGQSSWKQISKEWQMVYF